ncbi:MAG TPA: hypothetical protein VGH28_30575 [Polyangiaceae bacterium]
MGPGTAAGDDVRDEGRNLVATVDRRCPESRSLDDVAVTGIVALRDALHGSPSKAHRCGGIRKDALSILVPIGGTELRRAATQCPLTNP